MIILVALIIAGPEILFFRRLSEYLVHIMLGFFGLGFVFLFTSKTRLMLMSYSICAVLCVFLKNESNGELLYPKDNLTGQLVVGHINLSNIINQEEMLKVLNDSKIDVLSFQEFTPEWKEVLSSGLRKSYLYKYEAIRIDPFGKAIYSKYPITIFDTISKSIAFDVAFKVTKGSEEFTMISSYLTPALNLKSSTMAKTQMKNISEYLNPGIPNTIVLGEFNMVYWASEIRNFRDASKLNNCRKDVIPASLKLPYDHIFHSKELQCLLMKDILINRKERVGLIASFQKNLDIEIARNHFN